VLDGDPAPPPQKGAEPPPQFSAHVYCGKMAGWIKIALGTEVGFGPGHIVLDGDPASLPKKGAEPPQFSTHFSELSPVRLFAVCRLSVVCLSVTVVHPTQAVVIFGNISKAFGTLAIRWHQEKFVRRSSQGNSAIGGLNARGVAKYGDFGPIESYISETVRGRR